MMTTRFPLLRRLGALILTGALLVASPLPTLAQTIDRNAAAAIASRASNGRVLSIDLEGGVWRVKVLVRGTDVRIIYIDAETGQVQ